MSTGWWAVQYRHKGLHLARQTHCELRTGHCQRKTAQRKVQATATSTQQQQDTSKSPHSNSKGAFADFEPPPVIPASQLNLEDADLEEGPDDPAFELHEQDPRAQGGYTPFETLDFSDDDITHEVTVHVNAPRSKCFQIWLDRLNYLEWFDITQVCCTSSVQDTSVRQLTNVTCMAIPAPTTFGVTVTLYWQQSMLAEAYLIPIEHL